MISVSQHFEIGIGPQQGSPIPVQGHVQLGRDIDNPAGRSFDAEQYPHGGTEILNEGEVAENIGRPSQVDDGRSFQNQRLDDGTHVRLPRFEKAAYARVPTALAHSDIDNSGSAETHTNTEQFASSNERALTAANSPRLSRIEQSAVRQVTA